MTINKATARKIGNAGLVALEKVAAEHGLVVEYNGGSFDSESFKPKFVFKSGNADRTAFERVCWMYGLERGDFGAEFDDTFSPTERRYRVVGINTRASRMPILCEDVATGKRYRLTEAAVVRGLKIARELERD